MNPASAVPVASKRSWNGGRSSPADSLSSETRICSKTAWFICRLIFGSASSYARLEVGSEGQSRLEVLLDDVELQLEGVEPLLDVVELPGDSLHGVALRPNRR